MKGEQLPFFTFLEQLRTAKVEPVEAKIIDPEGISDIQFINVFPFTLITVCEVFDTYSCFMKTEPTVHVAWN